MADCVNNVPWYTVWDAKTGEKLDKDRFRRDMGGVEDAYQEIMRRVFGA